MEQIRCSMSSKEREIDQLAGTRSQMGCELGGAKWHCFMRPAQETPLHYIYYIQEEDLLRAMCLGTTTMDEKTDANKPYICKVKR